MKAETLIVRSILDALTGAGITAWRQQSGTVRVKRGWMHLAPEGTPDVIGYLRDGRMLGVEVKVPGARTEKSRDEAQRAWGARLVAAGGVFVRATSAAEVLEVLASAGSSLAGGAA